MAFAQNQSNLRRIGLRLVSASVQFVLVDRLVMPWNGLSLFRSGETKIVPAYAFLFVERATMSHII